MEIHGFCVGKYSNVVMHAIGCEHDEIIGDSAPFSFCEGS